MADNESGFITGALAGQQFQLNKFLIQEAPVKLETEKLALKVAQTDYDARQKMAQMIAQHHDKMLPGQNPLTNAANSLLEMGQIAVDSGLPEEGAADISKASTIMAQQEEAAYKNWQMVEQKAKFAGSILPFVTDQKTLDQANEYIEMSTGTPSALKGKQYSPELIESLRKGMASKRTQAQDALDRARAARELSLTNSDKVSDRLKESQIKFNEAKTERAKKYGADDLIAKPKNIQAVTDYIVKDSLDSMSPVDARVFAREIALDAERRMKEEGTSQPEAVAASVQYAKRHGKLAGITPAKERIGHNIGKPLPLPKKAEEFKDQMWYNNAGTPMWYDAETKSLYGKGEGPGDEEEAEGEE